MHLSIEAPEHPHAFPEYLLEQVLIKPVTDKQVFYDKFLCGKFYLLVCIASMLAFEQVQYLSQ